jgi:hypothetical protein
VALDHARRLSKWKRTTGFVPGACGGVGGVGRRRLPSGPSGCSRLVDSVGVDTRGAGATVAHDGEARSSLDFASWGTGSFHCAASQRSRLWILDDDDCDAPIHDSDVWGTEDGLAWRHHPDARWSGHALLIRGRADGGLGSDVWQLSSK